MRDVLSWNLILHVRISCILWASNYDLLISALWKGSPLQWRHNGRDGVSNHRHNDCLLSRLFRRRPKKTAKLRVTGLCAGNSPVTGEVPSQMASNEEKFFIWWHLHVVMRKGLPWRIVIMRMCKAYCPHWPNVSLIDALFSYSGINVDSV